MPDIAATVTNSDFTRILRFIDGQPISVRLDSQESISHDIEQFCAYRQDALNESAAMSNQSVGHFARAREAKVKLLDSLDKAITIIHLLTNSDWGPRVPPIRFLSCRQSAPLRDKSLVVGDFALKKSINDEIAMSLKVHQSSHHVRERMIELITFLHNRKLLFQMYASDSGTECLIDLVPSVNAEYSDRSGVAHCKLILASPNPLVKLHPLLENFVKVGWKLTVRVGSAPNAVVIRQGDRECERTLSVEDEIESAQITALDYLIICHIHYDVEKGNQLPSGWVRTRQSKHWKDFSASFVLTGNDSIKHVTVGMSTGESDYNLVSSIRKQYLHNCAGEHKHLSFTDMLLEEISRLT